MSSSALFGNNVTHGANKNLVEFKAGKMTMKGKMVFPDKRKGLVYVYQADDSLMHFCWKDRTTGIVEDDLIIFPEDCEFQLVSQCKTGRVYILKFKSSSRKLFFWLQDFKTDRDDENCKKMNEILNNPLTAASVRSIGANSDGDLQNILNNMSQQQLMQLFGSVGNIGGLSSLLGGLNRSLTENKSSQSSISTPAKTSKQFSHHQSLSSDISSKSNGGKEYQTNKIAESTATSSFIDNNKILLSDLQSFLSSIPPPPYNQVGIATELSQIIPTAISISDKLEKEIMMLLPPGDKLSITLSSPQFYQALYMFWSTLQSGQAASIIQQFNMSNEAVNAAASGNIEQFINVLEKRYNFFESDVTENKIKETQEQLQSDDTDDDKDMTL